MALSRDKNGMLRKNGRGETITVPNSSAHDQAVVRYLTLHGPAARRERAQARRELRSQRGPQAQLLLLDARKGNARRERSRLNKLVAAA